MFRNKYGLESEVKLSDLDLEAYCFLHGLSAGKCLGRFQHGLNYVKMVWPNIEWNQWLREQFRMLCDDDTAIVRNGVRIKTLAMTGSAAAGKTFSAGLFVSAWWRVSPHNSAVILCSTTKESLRKRIWSHIPTFWSEAIDPATGRKNPVGKMIESRTKLLYESPEDGKSRDDKFGIWGIAVRGGETQTAVQHIKGTHATRICIVVDEAEATPEAIMEAIPNLRKGCQEFVLIVLGNSVSHLDPHGLCCEPKDGWTSISVESESWLTKGVDRWQVEPGICLHFDGTKSPNVLQRRTQWPYLYSFEDYNAALSRPDYTETMAYWQHDRGFWPMEGLSDRIFTEQLIDKYEGRSRYQFMDVPFDCAFLDSAFGGDDCTLVFGKLGEIEVGKLGLEIIHNMIIPVKALSPDEMDYQIARVAIEQCKARGISPGCFGVDSTGIGRGVAAIMAGEWSPAIQRVEGSGSPTDRPSSTADGRPSTEVYDRFASELWWSAREMLQAGQLRGLYNQAIVQMCSRLYEVKNRKHRIEPKDAFKSRLGRSPDDADSCVGLCEVARRNGLAIRSAVAKRIDASFDSYLKESDELHEATMNEDEFSLEEAV